MNIEHPTSNSPEASKHVSASGGSTLNVLLIAKSKPDT